MCMLPVALEGDLPSQLDGWLLTHLPQNQTYVVLLEGYQYEMGSFKLNVSCFDDWASFNTWQQHKGMA